MSTDRYCTLGLNLIAATVLLVGCNPTVEPIVTGSTSSGAGGHGNGGPEVWKGYVEAYEFEDGTDSLTITVAGNPPIAKIVMGDHAIYPPPTDPNVPSPPVYRGDDLAGHDVTGFEFTGIATSITSTRMTFSVNPAEQWNAWCALETPVSWPSGSYECLPDTSEMTSGEPSVQCEINGPTNPTPVDCGKLYLCLDAMVCQCTMTSCAVPVPPKGDLQFDVAINGTHADGSLAGISNGSVYNVHLQLQ